jgi:hypothetical protein
MRYRLLIIVGLCLSSPLTLCALQLNTEPDNAYAHLDTPCKMGPNINTYHQEGDTTIHTYATAKKPVGGCCNGKPCAEQNSQAKVNIDVWVPYFQR